MVRLGDVVPNFTAKTQVGEIDFHEWLGGQFAILFSHPADYTPVCTTELGEIARRHEEFTARGVKVIALSVDSVEHHHGWISDIEASQGVKLTYPIIADEDRSVATTFGMLDHEEVGEKTAAGLPVTVRSVFIIGRDKRVKLTLTYPPAIGRNVDELFRVVDGLLRVDKHPVATPVNWQVGNPVMIQPSVSTEDAATRFPDHTIVEVPSSKKYIRTAADPGI